MRGHACAAGSGPGQGWPADLKAHLAYLSGGCIYTLGPQPGSTVRGNYCALDEAPVVGCFYHDNGSRGFVTSDNVADASGRDSNAPPPPATLDPPSEYAPPPFACPASPQASPAGAPCVYLQGCCGDPAVDIAVSGLWCRGVGAPRNGCAAENCTIDEATLHVVTGAWPEAAQAIVDAAGPTQGNFELI